MFEITRDFIYVFISVNKIKTHKTGYQYVTLCIVCNVKPHRFPSESKYILKYILNTCLFRCKKKSLTVAALVSPVILKSFVSRATHVSSLYGHPSSCTEQPSCSPHVFLLASNLAAFVIICRKWLPSYCKFLFRFSLKIVNKNVYRVIKLITHNELNVY